VDEFCLSSKRARITESGSSYDSTPNLLTYNDKSTVQGARPKHLAFNSLTCPTAALPRITTMFDSVQACQDLSELCRKTNHNIAHGTERLLRVSPHLDHHGRSLVADHLELDVAECSLKSNLSKTTQRIL
jgi:hypothetical protein